MRLIWIAALAVCVSAESWGEIHDVIKNEEIEARLAEKRPLVLQQRSNYTISLGVQTGKGSAAKDADADQVLFIRNGSGEVSVGNRRHAVTSGDFVYVPRATEHRIDAPAGSLGYVAVRVFPTGKGLPQQTGLLAPRTMPDVLSAHESSETFARFDANQPIHSGRYFTMNYVIYSGHAGPWEAHRGCVDIYFLRIGTAAAQLGGAIQDAIEESPGEIRGKAVTGARRYSIGPGDIVLIPRDTAHHMEPAGKKLGYLLLKVWAD